MSAQFLSIESKTTLSAVALGLLNHFYFHRFTPKSASGPILLLISQPFLLLLAIPASLSLSRILITYTIFFSALSLSIIVYRLSPWHPLAHIPGPTLNKITKFYGAWIVAGGHQHQVNRALHEKYGVFVRTGPNEISVIRVDAVKAVLGTGGFPKGEYYDPRRDPTLPTGSLLTLRGEAHANRRRLWNRGMSTESINEYEAILERRVVQLMDSLEGFAGQSGGTINIAGWFSYFAADVMGDMAFGGGFEMMRDGGDKDGLWALITRGARNIVVVSQTPWLASLVNKIPAGSGYKRLREFGASCASDRIKSGSKVKDLWYHLTDEAGMEKTKPTFAEVVADGVLSIVAGSDTTSVALSSFVWFILSNEDIYRRVQAEVDAVYSDEESSLGSSKHAELKFLAACLNEALRLLPPVLTNGPRQVPRGEGRMIADQFVPEHTQIYIPPYSLHRNAENFYSPDSFDPDRWLRDPEPGKVHNTAAFIPFSYGAANCVGKALAWREMLIVARNLIKRFELRFAQRTGSDAEWPDKLHDFFITSVQGPLLVEICRR